MMQIDIHPRLSWLSSPALFQPSQLFSTPIAITIKRSHDEFLLIRPATFQQEGGLRRLDSFTLTLRSSSSAFSPFLFLLFTSLSYLLHIVLRPFSHSSSRRTPTTLLFDCYTCPFLPLSVAAVPLRLHCGQIHRPLVY